MLIDKLLGVQREREREERMQMQLKAINKVIDEFSFIIFFRLSHEGHICS
mgnify:CR=1 FL=1